MRSRFKLLQGIEHKSRACPLYRGSALMASLLILPLQLIGVGLLGSMEYFMRFIAGLGYHTKSASNAWRVFQQAGNRCQAQDQTDLILKAKTTSCYLVVGSQWGQNNQKGSFPWDVGASQAPKLEKVPVGIVCLRR